MLAAIYDTISYRLIRRLQKQLFENYVKNYSAECPFFLFQDYRGNMPRFDMPSDNQKILEAGHF